MNSLVPPKLTRVARSIQGKTCVATSFRFGSASDLSSDRCRKKALVREVKGGGPKGPNNTLKIVVQADFA